MIVIKKLLILIIAVCLSFCASETTDYRKKGFKKKEVTKTKQPLVNVQDKDIPDLKEVKFTSDVMVKNPFKIEIITSDDKVFDSNLHPKYDIKYEWIVNKNKLPDIQTDELSPEYFNAGDWIGCTIRLVNDKGKIFRILISKVHQVTGLPPLLDLQPVIIPDIPGIFTYQITATDAPENYPVLEDNETFPDNLTYEIISPKDTGIRINPSTGFITWNLTPKIIEGFNHQVEIKFKVENPFNASIEGVITLQFRTETRQKENL